MDMLERFPIFSQLDPEFQLKVKIVAVFGNMGNEAVIVAKDDDVYSLGSNLAGCLGINELSSTLIPRKIDALCGLGIADIAYGSGPHVLVCTSDGSVFAWGHNGYCQLGDGCTHQSSIPLAVGHNLAQKKVVKVACGGHHSVCLTDDGEVWAWGQNSCGQIGTGSTANAPSPKKVISGISGKRVTVVSCGQTSTMALTDAGEVYGWGYNGNGQLGIGNNVNQPVPCKVTHLAGAVVTAIVCGYSHALALTDEGVLYVWGANSYGQLGTGSKTNVSLPTKLPIGLVATTSSSGGRTTPTSSAVPSGSASPGGNIRVVEIAAHHSSHLSAVMTLHSQVFMWGQCKGLSILVPTETNFRDLDSVFASFSQPPNTFRPVEIMSEARSSVTEALRKAFDDPASSDLKFLVDGKPIHVHKAVLKIRSERFQRMFADDANWVESTADTVEIKDFSYNVFRAFLHYLYTDTVDLAPEDAIGLLDLAEAYCEDGLRLLCGRIIRQGISVSNAAMLYAAAIRYAAADLEEFCFKFLTNHLTEIAKSGSLNDLDEACVKSFLVKAAEAGAFRF